MSSVDLWHFQKIEPIDVQGFRPFLDRLELNVVVGGKKLADVSRRATEPRCKLGLRSSTPFVDDSLDILAEDACEGLIGLERFHNHAPIIRSREKKETGGVQQKHRAVLCGPRGNRHLPGSALPDFESGNGFWLIDPRGI